MPPDAPTDAVPVPDQGSAATPASAVAAPDQGSAPSPASAVAAPDQGSPPSPASAVAAPDQGSAPTPGSAVAVPAHLGQSAAAAASIDLAGAAASTGQMLTIGSKNWTGFSAGFDDQTFSVSLADDPSYWVDVINGTSPVHDAHPDVVASYDGSVLTLAAREPGADGNSIAISCNWDTNPFTGTPALAGGVEGVPTPLDAVHTS